MGGHSTSPPLRPPPSYRWFYTGERGRFEYEDGPPPHLVALLTDHFAALNVELRPDFLRYWWVGGWVWGGGTLACPGLHVLLVSRRVGGWVSQWVGGGGKHMCCHWREVWFGLVWFGLVWFGAGFGAALSQLHAPGQWQWAAAFVHSIRGV